MGSGWGRCFFGELGRAFTEGIDCGQRASRVSQVASRVGPVDEYGCNDVSRRVNEMSGSRRGARYING